CSYIKQGMDLALLEHPDSGINIIFEDDHSIDRKASLTAAQKLVNFDNVDLFTTWTASSIPLLAPVADRSKTPLVAGAYDRNVKQGGPYVFGSLVNYELLPRQIAQFLFNAQKAKRFALILAADDWSQSFAGPFEEELTSLGGTLVMKETLSPQETDMRSIVLKLRDQNIDAVLSPLYGTSLYSFLKQSSELHFKGMIHVGDGMFEEDLKIAGESAEGIYATQIWLRSEELTSLLRKHFSDSLNPLQLGLLAGGYDWILHIIHIRQTLLAEGKKLSKENLREALAHVSTHGFLGEQMYGAPPSTSGEINVVVRNGTYVPIPMNKKTHRPLP
ncbi:MAG: ABC transporter substrate-binding protein, partial [Bdellovibrionales bacterium]|nr:ABC transporter substrate-binding protein [Bdellovibrionales bacterium]